MKLDNEDRDYLDKHFSDVHEKINNNGKAIVRLETKFDGHENNPCKNMVKHLKEHKGMCIFMISLVVAILGLIVKIFI